MCKMSGKEGKRPAWLNHDLLVKLKGKEGTAQTVEAGTGILGRV